MLLMQGKGEASESISGTDYRVEYEILQSTKGGEGSPETEYGISCKLFKGQKLVDWSEVERITIQKNRAERFLHIIKINQVFPVHLRDVIEDLLVLEFEERKYHR